MSTHTRRPRATLIALAALTTSAVVLTGCSTGAANSNQGNGGNKDGNLTIFATTGYLGDLAKNLVPDAKITVMVKPGGDPHTYQPTTKDTKAMQEADVVLSNGVHLEAHMLDQLKSLGDKHLAVGDAVNSSHLLPWPEKDAQGNPLHDPHIWNSPTIWKEVTQKTSEKLAALRPAKKNAIESAAKDYQGKIDAETENIKKLLAPIPKNNRLLITGHDAFNYFGKAFDLEIKATDFVTSEAEMSPAQMQELAAVIAERKIPVIFQDNLKNPQAITSLKEAVVAKGGKVEVSDTELFADTLGDDKPNDTYLGVMKHNAETIAKALVPAP